MAKGKQNAGATRPKNDRVNPRGNYPGPSPGGMPNQGVPGTVGMKTRGQFPGGHIGPGQDWQGQGPRPLGSIDPGFDRQQGPRPRPGGPPNRGSEGWLAKHPNGPLAQRGTQPGGFPETPGFDFDAFNAWDDPNISGEEGMLDANYGGFSALNAQGGMLPTKLNNYLNQQSVGGDRERMMNQLGYNNQGRPYTPQGLGAAGGGDYSGYTSPGIYQQEGSTPYGSGYEGVSNVDQFGQGAYTSFAGRQRPRRRY